MKSRQQAATKARTRAGAKGGKVKANKGSLARSKVTPKAASRQQREAKLQ